MQNVLSPTDVTSIDSLTNHKVRMDKKNDTEMLYRANAEINLRRGDSNKIETSFEDFTPARYTALFYNFRQLIVTINAKERPSPGMIYR